MKIGLAVFALAYCADISQTIAQPKIPREIPSCPPSAVLDGQDALVAELESELRELDVGLTPNSDCPSTEVSVESLSSGFFISLQEESGRSTYRQVGTLRIAAVWIDSWLQEDLATSLLTPRSLPPRPQATPDRQSIGLLSTDTISDKDSSPWVLGLAYDRSTASDSTDWQGIRAGICYPLSSACLGTSLRIAESTTSIDNDINSDTYAQSSQDLLVTLRTSIPLGRSLLIPQVGIGYGRLVTQTSTVCDQGIVPPGACPDIDDNQLSDRSSWAPRGELSLALSLPLSQRIRLSLGGALNIRPFGTAVGKSNLQTPPPLPDCEPASDPLCIDVPPEPVPEDIYLPADPDRFWRLSIGVEVKL